MRTLVLISLILTGCHSLAFFPTRNPQKPKLDNSATIPFEVNAFSYSGIAVVPRSDKYSMKFNISKWTEKLIVSTCNREEMFEEFETPFEYVYEPKTVEKDCLFRLYAIKSNGEEFSAVIDFENSEIVKAVSTCNGKTISRTGIELCQSRAGLIQSIEFEDPVVWVTQDGCNPMQQVSPVTYQYKVNAGFCAYKFISKDKRKFRLTTFGFVTREKK